MREMGSEAGYFDRVKGEKFLGRRKN